VTDLGRLSADIKDSTAAYYPTEQYQ